MVGGTVGLDSVTRKDKHMVPRLDVQPITYFLCWKKYEKLSPGKAILE